MNTETPVIDHEFLRDRVGPHLYRQRMNLQAYHASQAIGQGRTLLHPENLPLLRGALTLGLGALGLYRWGRRNARAIQVRENTVVLRRLPPAFEGYRILHLSDLHLDLDPGITDALIERLHGISYDCCVITGDFRAETWGDFGPAVAQTARVIPHLHAPLFGILGNHDFLEMAQPLEELGIRMLLNEHTAIEREGVALYIAGIDDPHFYETDNLEKAVQGIPLEATRILLSHSAEPHRQALACGVDLMLSGHTHGGQLCLPGGIALLRNAHHPAYMLRGPWRYQELQGYTSTGVGCSLVPLRYFCPPEITVHRLTRQAG